MANPEEVDFNESDPRQQDPPSSQFKDLARGLGWLAAIALAIWLGMFALGRMRSAGWIAQSRVVDVYIDGDWLTGEYRPCQTGARADALYCPASGESQTAQAAIGQGPRQFSVSFYGAMTGTPGQTLSWNCKRETESIRCQAVR